jgi:CheY-like chemotaxis protein
MSKILVVEDSRTQRYMVTNILTASQFTVTAAKDGIEALEQIHQACPDVVVLDVLMPHLNVPMLTAIGLLNKARMLTWASLFNRKN